MDQVGAARHRNYQADAGKISNHITYFIVICFGVGVREQKNSHGLDSIILKTNLKKQQNKLLVGRYKLLCRKNQWEILLIWRRLEPGMHLHLCLCCIRIN